MTLDELIAEVYTLTWRPDMVAQTKAAVKSSVLKMHSIEFFYKDLVEADVVFANASYIQNIDTVTKYPRWRALSYFRPVLIGSDGTAAPKGFFEIISPTAVLDEYGLDKVNIAYQAGVMLNLKCEVEFSRGIVGYYQYPNLTDELFDSWIAREFPYAVIYDAATKLLKSLRYDEQANGTKVFAGEFTQELIASNIQPVGV